MDWVTLSSSLAACSKSSSGQAAELVTHHLGALVLAHGGLLGSKAEPQPLGPRSAALTPNESPVHPRHDGRLVFAKPHEALMPFAAFLDALESPLRAPPSTRPLLFLDVDGVINTHANHAGGGEGEGYGGGGGGGDNFYPPAWEAAMREQALVLSREKLGTLARLVDTLDASLVLSTSWRTDHATARPALLAALAAFGVDAGRVVGSTPDLYGVSEGCFPAGVPVWPHPPS